MKCGQRLLKNVSRTRPLELKWVQKWATNRTKPTSSPDNKNKFYGLAMFPYPSGKLHMGHLRVYTIADVLAKYRRMKGQNVIHPMGWDAFGLPAENAAIERNIDPAEWTRSNIHKMKEQIDIMAADFDWSREFATCDPEYYRWTQQLFIWMYNEGLAYRGLAEVNWDPVEKTVLANEQVDSEGKSWRSGAIVEKRKLEQWFLAITKYAEQLHNDLDMLDWPEFVKTMQKNWIGLSFGTNITFKNDTDEIQVYTTRPETLFGVEALTVSLDHPLTEKYSSPELTQFKNQNFEEGSSEKLLLPIKVFHPITGEEIPVYTAPYVLGSYGTGAVMVVPAHDERDKRVFNDVTEPKHVIDDGKLINSSEFDGLTVEEARKQISEKLKNMGLGFVEKRTKMRDWLISRQRYWGAPIPMIHCDNCGIVPVPDDQLPVLLPNEVKPLSENDDYIKCKCPKCHQDAKRDTDTMDTFMDSSWYFLRYLDPKNNKQIVNPDIAKSQMPVDFYLGGVEHSILHLLYARFVSKFLNTYLDKSNPEGLWGHRGEPFLKLVSQGMVHGKTYKDPKTGRFLKPDEVDSNGIMTDGRVASVTYEKMSKSKHNGVDPESFILKNGIDATRSLVLFQAPIPEVLVWDESQVKGTQRFLKRVLDIAERVTEGPLTESIRKWTGVIESDYENFTYNTLISNLMKMAYKVEEECTFENFAVFLKLLYPVCPVHAEECWEILANKKGISWTSIGNEKFPDVKLDNNIGKFHIINPRLKKRVALDAPKDISKDDLIKLIKNDPVAQNWIKNDDTTKLKFSQFKVIIG